jgi:hypothetical protein
VIIITIRLVLLATRILLVPNKIKMKWLNQIGRHTLILVLNIGFLESIGKRLPWDTFTHSIIDEISKDSTISCCKENMERVRGVANASDVLHSNCICASHGLLCSRIFHSGLLEMDDKKNNGLQKTTLNHTRILSSRTVDAHFYTKFPICSLYQVLCSSKQ